MYEFGVPITPEKTPPPVTLKQYLTGPESVIRTESVPRPATVDSKGTVRFSGPAYVHRKEYLTRPATVDSKGQVHRSPIGDDGSL